jgi:pimeloyl-ACP methyl ester carboxylesterase
MVPGTVRIAGRRLRFAISDNQQAHGPDGPGTPPIWAVSLHGYFAGGQMYNRESAWLAERLGWRVVNPSLPGFGGSDPLTWSEVSMSRLADQVATLLSHLDAGPVVLLGHSMGGAVAVQFAHDHPTTTLGLIYRGGVATPAWQNRHSVITAALAAVTPDAAPFVDMMAAIALDTPDLLIGRLYSTVRSLLPDVRRNIRSMGSTLPIGSMLMSVDLRPELRGLVAQNMPILPVWGCFDRVSNTSTAVEFSEVVRAPVQWVPGGHSWMLARPHGQSDLLEHVESGRRFLHAVEDRWRRISSVDRSLRAVN